jgi:ankyrin repeat protein
MKGKMKMKTLKSIALIATILFVAIQTSLAQEIFEAVKADDFARVKALIEKDTALVNYKDNAGNTPLHQAAISGSIEIAEFFLSRGADINSANIRKNTPLHEAVDAGKKNISRLLIERGADINQINLNRETPLHRAAWLNQREIGELLIAKGASIDPRDFYQRTPFMYVARQSGDVEFGKLMLNNGANINLKDRDNQMALNLAAWRGFNLFIDFLLDHGAEYDTTRDGARFMLSSAADCGSLRLFKVVLDREKELAADEPLMKNIMRSAIMGGSVDIVQLLLKQHIPLDNTANRYGWTPMHYAAARGHTAMIRFLAERKFDINKRTLSGKSVYNIAKENNRIEVIGTIEDLKGDTSPERFPELTGAYLGQTPPVGELVLFAPDIVSSSNGDDNHGSIAFMPDGKEIYWNMRSKIWMTKQENMRWTEPAIVSFCRDDSLMYDNPFITFDGKRMFFTSTRPGAVSEKKENIWYVERTSSGWSEPKPVSSEVNAMQLHWSISVSNAGTLYFGGRGEENYGEYDIYYSQLVNGAYTKPVNMGPEINGEGTDHCPYIAPDESYIIFSRFGDAGAGFFISYKDKSGKWLAPAKIHEELEGACPLISPDGKFFFLNSDGIYWMPAKFVEGLRPKE